MVQYSRELRAALLQTKQLRRYEGNIFQLVFVFKIQKWSEMYLKMKKRKFNHSVVVLLNKQNIHSWKGYSRQIEEIFQAVSKWCVLNILNAYSVRLNVCKFRHIVYFHLKCSVLLFYDMHLLERKINKSQNSLFRDTRAHTHTHTHTRSQQLFHKLSETSLF